MDFTGLWERLRRRKVATWTAAYVTAAAALLGTLETIGNSFGWHVGILRAAFFVLIAGLVATLIVAWYHGEKGRQRISGGETILLAAVVFGGIAAAGWSYRAGQRADEIADAGTTVAHEALPENVTAAREAYEEAEEALRHRTPASVVQAIGSYREAAELDPSMTAALAREGYAYGLYVDWGWTYPGLDSEELLERGLALTDRAIELDSLSAEGWLTRAYLLQLSNPMDPAIADPAFARAVELDPTNAEAQHQYGQLLMQLGRFAEARSAYHAALAIEPDRPMTLVALSAMSRFSGDVEEGRRWADSSVVVGAGAPYAWASRALNTIQLRDPEEIAADAREALRIDPSYEVPARAMLAAALSLQGDGEAAARELERSLGAVVDLSAPNPTDGFFIAAAMAYMERPEEALEVLEATRPRSPLLWFLLQSPAFDPLREKSRFQAIVEESKAPRTRAD